jgi:cyclohexanone monooxygenase
VRKDWPTDPNWARKLKLGWQAKRREKVLAAVERSPEEKAQLDALTKDEKLQQQENGNIDYMMRIHQRIDDIVEDKETASALKPWYMFMCKRPCFHNDYLPAFNLPNVHLVDTKGKGITEINEKGPVFEGTEYELDVLIYATGFEVQQTGIYNNIVGKENINLTDKYKEGIRTLLGIHTTGFPNLFIMGGYQASFQFNLTDMLQTQGDHIAACIDYVRSNGFRTIDPTDEAEEWWVQEVIKHRGKTSRSEECTPGYYNMEGASQRRQDGNYNGGFRQYFKHQGEVRDRISECFTLEKL